MRHNSNILNTHLTSRISWLSAAGMHPTADVVTFVKVAKRIKQFSA